MSITHMVLFTLKHAPDSAEEAAFLADGQRILSALPMVRDFQALRQVGKKNAYRHCFSMVFDNEQDYAAYNGHPNHCAFVRDRWDTEVIDFLEMDLV